MADSKNRDAAPSAPPDRPAGAAKPKDKRADREARLAEALRANLRRRKTGGSKDSD